LRSRGAEDEREHECASLCVSISFRTQVPNGALMTLADRERIERSPVYPGTD